MWQLSGSLLLFTGLFTCQKTFTPPFIVLFLVAAVLEIAVFSFSISRKLFLFFAEGYCPVSALLLAVYTDPSDVSGSGSDSGQFLFDRARNLHTGYLYDSDVSNGQRANSIQAKATLERCPGCLAIGPEALLGRRNVFLVFGPWGLRLSRKASAVDSEWIQLKHWQHWRATSSICIIVLFLVAAVLEIAVIFLYDLEIVSTMAHDDNQIHGSCRIIRPL